MQWHHSLRQRPRHLTALTKVHPAIAIVFGLLFLTSTVVDAEAREILFLTNGRQIVVDRYWEEGDQVFYEKNGSTFGFPGRLLARVERFETLPSSSSSTSDASGAAGEGNDPPSSGYRNQIADEAVEEARASRRSGDSQGAARMYRKAIRSAPNAVEIRLELAQLHFQRGDYLAAQAELELAKRVAPNDSQVRELLGDVYYERGRTPLAIREWQSALETNPGPGVVYKLKKALRENDEDIDFEELNHPRFVVRYDGRVNERIGALVLATLDDAFRELSKEFHFTPHSPFTVTLYTNQEFRDVTHAPEWVAGLNDGEIRVPVDGITEMTPKLNRVLRHELAHSFINAVTSSNCPAWFHEGLAQVHEGPLKIDPYPPLKAAKQDGTIFPLWSLEGSLTHYSKEQVLVIYSEALAAAQYIQERRGRDAHVRILKLLAEGQTMNDALREVVGLDYQEFQTAFEADLDRYRR